MNMPNGSPKHLPAEEWYEAVKRMLLVSMDLIVNDSVGRILVGLRKNKPAKGKWFVPSGVVRKYETLDAAFLRLLSAELGLDAGLSAASEGADICGDGLMELRLKSLSGVYEHHYPDNFKDDSFGTHYVVMAHRLSWEELLEAFGFSSLPLEQHAGYKWMDVGELVGDPMVHENTKAYFL